MRFVLLSLLGASLVTGCADDPEIGSATVCLATEADVTPDELNTADFQVTGALVSDGPATDLPYDENNLNLFSCDGIARALLLQDDTGRRWWIGYGVQDGAGKDVTQAVDATPGADVQLRFRSVQGFSEASGFVLTDAQGLVSAIERGEGFTALKPGDIPGLEVTVGDVVGTSTDDCGTLTHSALVFAAGESVELAPGEEGTIRIDGIGYAARNITSYERSNTTCTDIGGARAWMVAR